jgi:hypothetical protein
LHLLFISFWSLFFYCYFKKIYPSASYFIYLFYPIFIFILLINVFFYLFLILFFNLVLNYFFVWLFYQIWFALFGF